MLKFVHRDGSPYPDTPEALLAWASDHEIFGNRVVDSTWTLYGERISTIWLGFDQSFGLGRSQFFETMVFDRNGEILGQWRWNNEIEARIGHERLSYQALIPRPLRGYILEGWR
jgi:hypothetical protein